MMKTKTVERKKNNFSMYILQNRSVLPIVFIVAVIPLIVYLKVFPLEGIVADYWIDKDIFDFFSYYKAFFFCLTTLIAIFICFYLYYKDKIVFIKSYIYIPISIFALFILLSTLFAEYKGLALMGYPGRYEGMYVLLAYLLIMVLTLNMVQNPQQITLIMGGLLVSATIIGIIGIFQYFGFSFFQSSFGKWLILPSSHIDLATDLSFKDGLYRIVSTLYNSNFVGSYMAMLVAITFIYTLCMKQRKYSLVTGVISCLMFANLIGSNSRAGMVGAALAFVILFILFYKLLFTHWRKVALLLCSYVLIFLLLNMVSSGKALSQIDSIWDINEEEEQSLVLEDIQLGQRSVEFIYNKDLLIFSIEDNSELVIKDGQQEDVDFSFNDEQEAFVLEDPRFQNYTFVVRDNVLVIGVGKALLYFASTSEGMRFINEKGELITFEEVESWGFEGRERQGSSRGYIWSRSLPMLKETIFLGHGPDSYVVYFPQHDYVGKLLYMGDSFDLVDKPHNMYLQTAINTGVPSLLAMLVMFGMYLITSVRLYWQNSFEHFYAISGLAILIAIIGYLVAGMFNDSVVSVAPVFWVLFGLGMACNYLYREELRKSQSAR